MTRMQKKPMAIAGAGAATGALVAYICDPQSGKRRRHEAGDRIAAFFRRRWRRVGRTAHISAAYGSGLAKRATHLREEEKPGMDDVTLARKIETEIFRDAGVPKGQINVNAEDGSVFLRGEVRTPELLDELERKAGRVQGVREVRNLMHLPGQPAPMRV